MNAFGSTELDALLENLENAVSSENLWDSSAYASQILEYVEANGMNPDLPEDLTTGLLRTVTDIRDTAERMMTLEKEKAQSDQEFKDNLIDEIVNFKG